MKRVVVYRILNLRNLTRNCIKILMRTFFYFLTENLLLYFIMKLTSKKNYKWSHRCLLKKTKICRMFF